MPYKNLEDLPESVRDNLPHHAQEICKEAYNSAWEEYADPSSRREEVAHRVARAAVKKKIRKRCAGQLDARTVVAAATGPEAARTNNGTNGTKDKEQGDCNDRA